MFSPKSCLRVILQVILRWQLYQVGSTASSPGRLAFRRPLGRAAGPLLCASRFSSSSAVPLWSFLPFHFLCWVSRCVHPLFSPIAWAPLRPFFELFTRGVTSLHFTKDFSPGGFILLFHLEHTPSFLRLASLSVLVPGQHVKPPPPLQCWRGSLTRETHLVLKPSPALSPLEPFCLHQQQNPR